MNFFVGVLKNTLIYESDIIRLLSILFSSSEGGENDVKMVEQDLSILFSSSGRMEGRSI